MKMDIINEVLEKHWESGFFYDLQRGVFDPNKGMDLLMPLKKADGLLNDEVVDIRFVRLMWPVPLLLVECQKNFTGDNVLSGDALREMKNMFAVMSGEINRIINFINY